MVIDLGIIGNNELTILNCNGIITKQSLEAWKLRKVTEGIANCGHCGFDSTSEGLKPWPHSMVASVLPTFRSSFTFVDMPSLSRGVETALGEHFVEPVNAKGKP